MRDFMDALDVLADAGKLGMVLFQFPPWFVPSLKHVHYVEQIVEAFSSYAVAIEFRHRSWFSNSARASTLRWLRELRAVNVVCDEPQIGNGTIPLVADVTNSRYVMFRLHGRNEQTWYQKGLASSQQRFDYLYGKDELTALLPMVQRWAHQVSEVHVLMNNNQADYAVTNAQDWQALLGQPVRSREVERVESKQLSLFDGESL
ncbi:hypothetical protein GCM10025857_36630 [Alicyclobacillus contaminans]|nr:hypothetical protein GCM10025857_36630 [Alicyclobacillus contaminans]